MTEEEKGNYYDKIPKDSIASVRRKLSMKVQKILGLENEIKNLNIKTEQKKFSLSMHKQKRDIIEGYINSVTISGSMIISDQCKIDYANLFYDDITKEILRNLDTCVLKNGCNSVVFNGEPVDIIVKNNVIVKLIKEEND